MYKLRRTSTLIVLAALVLSVFGVAAAAADERSDKILANLKLQFQQLRELEVTMGEITPSGFEGLHQGSFTVQTPRGPQPQNFFVSADDMKLYMVSEPFDVSKSKADIDAQLAEEAKAKAEAAAHRKEDLAAATAGLPVRGNPDAKVTIIEFSDFQCPYCARGAATVDQILEKHGDDVKVVFKHFPLDFHPWARPAAIAAHCAGQQKGEAFWSLHDKYFANQKEITPENVLAKTKEFLAESGIDMGAWATCAENKESDAYKAADATVSADMALGQKHGVSGTPGFFVNGRFLNGAQPLDAFEPLIAEAKND